MAKSPSKKPGIDKKELKHLLRQILAENPKMLRAAVIHAIEDVGMANAIREGMKGKKASEAEVFKTLRGKS